ncbi:MAG: UPF0262 family protein [Alphaproteobacteria bacterium]
MAPEAKDSTDGDRQQRIVALSIEGQGVVRYHPDVERERAVAIFDLVEENFFRPSGGFSGPYVVQLSNRDRRLIFDIRSEDGAGLCEVKLALLPFRKTIKDYFTVCESYYEAISSAGLARIEALDMGRRGLHNEGSERLMDQLAGRIEVDLATARRLFTLICVLHLRE